MHKEECRQLQYNTIAYIYADICICMHVCYIYTLDSNSLHSTFKNHDLRQRFGPCLLHEFLFYLDESDLAGHVVKLFLLFSKFFGSARIFCCGKSRFLASYSILFAKVCANVLIFHQFSNTHNHKIYKI